ncbi:hypothetical protein J4730_03640 [Klebsiella pneumoniae]|uniref:Uncharacterized protein n=1 Tax=Klebsiella pneumoniae TaxID=573 RepID=A0A939NNU4_KLEPN|nr:hypothetical protein [Klebsiella pneumoniae]
MAITGARAYLVYNATDTVTVKGGWATAFKAPSRSLTPTGPPTPAAARAASSVTGSETGNQRKLRARSLLPRGRGLA